MERKSKQPTRKRVQKLPPVPRTIKTDSAILRSAFALAPINTDTSGVAISTVVGASISQTSEYAAMGSLFKEVRLLAFEIKLGFLYVHNNDSKGYNPGTMVVMGTDPTMNTNNSSDPTSYNDVQNRPDVQYYISNKEGIIRKRMRVAPNLEFLPLTADAPTTPTPFAGSPGVIAIYGNGWNTGGTGAPVTTYVLCFGTWELRGRS